MPSEATKGETWWISELVLMQGRRENCLCWKSKSECPCIPEVSLVIMIDICEKEVLHKQHLVYCVLKASHRITVYKATHVNGHTAHPILLAVQKLSERLTVFNINREDSLILSKTRKPLLHRLKVLRQL
jgi:hypothetical protein